MRRVTLARMWRRQLFAASGAALIVPSAMIAALVALALGGGFSQLGVLGQVFAGPPAPSAGALAMSRAAPATAGGSIPTISVAQTDVGPAGRGSASAGGRVRAAVTAPRAGGVAPGVGSSGGTIAPGGTTRPIVGGAAPAPVSPARPAPVSSSPSPAPSPRPTPVGTVVKVVTSVTSQVPAPVGPAVTQAVRSVGSAADDLLPSLP
jgi:hypothetical protein